MKNAVWVNLPYDAKHLGCIADPSRPGIGSESGGMGTEGIMTLITSEPPQLRRAIYLQLYEPPSVFNYSSIMHKQIPFVKTSALLFDHRPFAPQMLLCVSVNVRGPIGKCKWFLCW